MTKAEEAAITSYAPRDRPPGQDAKTAADNHVMDRYAQRYLRAYGGALQGMRIGVFQHSAVGRDELTALVAGLGAVVVPLGRSATFVPIDTEAVADDLRERLRGWTRLHSLDAIVSTDADGDRPLLTDAQGAVVPGDILGQITARSLGARHVVTPISSNSGVQQSGAFDSVTFTKIGSPYVLAGMGKQPGNTVGYEANGGFILGYDTGNLTRLLTRDALLPICAVLGQAQANGVAACVAQEPPRITATDRLQDIAPERAKHMLGVLRDDGHVRREFLNGIGLSLKGLDLTDGLRMIADQDQILHLRQSGNAPELRVYVEAGTHEMAKQTLQRALSAVQAQLCLNSVMPQT